MNSSEFIVRPIGFVRSARDEAVDDGWDHIETRIELDPNELAPDATLGLSDFSHVEVVFLFDRAEVKDICRSARRSRGRDDWPLTGILSQRSKDRPNRIGVTICKLLKVDGLNLHVRGLDAIDGTPVLDIKPMMSGYLPRGEFREPNWAKRLMSTYWD